MPQELVTSLTVPQSAYQLINLIIYKINCMSHCSRSPNCIYMEPDYYDQFQLCQVVLNSQVTVLTFGYVLLGFCKTGVSIGYVAK